MPCGPKPALCRELAEESVGCRKPYKNVRFGAGNVSHIDGKAGPAPVTIAAVRPGPIHRWNRAPMQGGCLVYEYLGSKGSEVYTTRFGGNQVEALRNVSFSVEQGEYVAVMGESGSGKTTLLNILAALDKPTAGSVVLDGRELSKVGDADAAAFRRDNLGFVFQEFNLLDTFSLEDNIALPLVLAGKGYREINERLMPVARRLGIAELLKKYPYEVSGGQKQRAAVARAIITRPSLLLADEPTGALDSRSSDELLRLFGELNRGGQTIVMVTHSVRAASTAGRVLFIKDGEVFHQLYRGGRSEEQFYQEISGTLTLLATGGMEQ